MASRAIWLIIELGLGGDFAADHHDVAFGVGFAGHAAVGVLRQAGVQHRIGNGIANFVRMAFADGLRREDVSFCSFKYLLCNELQVFCLWPSGEFYHP